MTLEQIEERIANLSNRINGIISPTLTFNAFTKFSSSGFILIKVLAMK